MDIEKDKEPVEGIDKINSRLIELYGKDVSVSQPNYRIVWSSGQHEWRTNPEGFDIYSETGDMFLRTEYGPHECEKYPLFPDMWVLETLIPKHGANLSLIVDPVKYSYEPLFVFGAGNSCPQPIWKAVQFLVHAHKFKQDVMEKKTDKDLLLEDMKNLAREKEDCKMYLQNENPIIPTLLHSGEAVTVPNKEFGENNV